MLTQPEALHAKHVRLENCLEQIEVDATVLHAIQDNTLGTVLAKVVHLANINHQAIKPSAAVTALQENTHQVAKAFVPLVVPESTPMVLVKVLVKVPAKLRLAVVATIVSIA